MSATAFISADSSLSHVYRAFANRLLSPGLPFAIQLQREVAATKTNSMAPSRCGAARL